ncbi:MAG: DUF465 domain-containing protein [Zoogloeaceae bacterium]|jgi:hypothetical protein|nr:DUF465 domain-containing protein [Zoogloeaceae bacterium]
MFRVNRLELNKMDKYGQPMNAAMTPPKLPLSPEEHAAIRKRLRDLLAEHEALDKQVTQLTRNSPPADQLLIPRLKKRKLQIRDHIWRLEALLTPDDLA